MNLRSNKTVRGGKVTGILALLGVLAIWMILQAWVLPRLGVKT
jgi:hypothetical protein